MTAGASQPFMAADMEGHEERLKRLHDVGASDKEIAEAAWAFIEHLLEIGHFHMAAMLASQYGYVLDDGRKLDVLERMLGYGMDPYLAQLCGCWKVVRRCERTRPQLYRGLFPQLPPRNPKQGA